MRWAVVPLLAFFTLGLHAQQLETPDPHHRFWDKQNVRLHLLNATAQTLDAYTTQTFLARHTGKEGNPFARMFVTHGWAGQVAYSYGWDTAGAIGLSYWFHRHNHHRLERLTPVMVGVPTFIFGAQNLRLFHAPRR